MKRLFYFILFLSASGLRFPASGQTLTSYYELKLRSATTDKLVPGKNVDLYAAGTANKIYDLTESTTTPGVYYHNTVANGMYDIYVNTSLWKSNIWIGANKVTLISDVFTFGPDSMNFDSGVVTALRYFGDGSNLTGISGAGGVSNAGDTNIGADTDNNGTGQIFFNTRTVQRGTVANDGTLIWGEDTTDVAGSAVVVGGTLAVTSDDDSANVLSLSAIDGQYTAIASGRTANKTFVPMTFWVKAKEVARFDTTKALFIGMLNTDGTGSRGQIIARGLTVVSDTVNASTIGFLPNTFGANYLLSYHTGSGTDLPMALSTGLGSAVYVASDARLGINTTSFGTSATNTVSIKVGTAPSTSPADVVQLYAEDVGGSAELKIRDEAGNVTVLSDLTAGGGGFDGHKTAMAFFPSTSNGADYAVLNSREEVYAFDASTAETLYVKYKIPETFTSVDSMTFWVSVNSTAGDSVGLVLDWLARDDGESVGGAVGGNLSKQIDLGTTALQQKRLTISGSFTGIAAGDILLLRLYRNPAISNDVAADVNLHDTTLWLH